MTSSQQEKRRFSPDYIPAPLANAMLDLKPLDPREEDQRRRLLTQDEIDAVAAQTDSRILRHEDDIAQVNELYLVRRVADQIEAECAKNNMPLPTVHSILTGKIHNPFPNAVKLGSYAEDKPFEFIPATDIAGHKGDVTISKIDENHSFMAWEGRGEHTYEWLRHRYGDIVASRKMNVIKEIIRRQRERGENPIVINTQLAGTYEKSPLAPGDLAVIVADFEEGPNLNLGIGHNSFFDRFFGIRFQAKWGRSLNEANLALARKFLSITQKLNIGAGPMGIIGDAEAPDFEDWFDIARSVNTFRTALELGFAKFAKKVFKNPENLPNKVKDVLRFFLTFRQNWLAKMSSSTPENIELSRFQKVIYSFRSHEPSLGWGMGNSLEPTNLRRLLMRPSLTLKNVMITESEIPTLNLAVITDFGGPNESPKADHLKFIKKAEDGAPKYERALREIARAVVGGQVALPQPQTEGNGFSLNVMMFEEANRREEILEAEIISQSSPVPQTISNIHFNFIEPLMKLQEEKAELYRTFGFPDFAQGFEKNDPELAITVENLREVQNSLKGDGKLAYKFFIELRDRQLKGAEGRLAKSAYLQEHSLSSDLIASETLTPELMLERRKNQLRSALRNEVTARIIAGQYSKFGVTHSDMIIETE